MKRERQRKKKETKKKQTENLKKYIFSSGNRPCDPKAMPVLFKNADFLSIPKGHRTKKLKGTESRGLFIDFTSETQVLHMPVQIKHKLKRNAPQGPNNCRKKLEKRIFEKSVSKVENCSWILSTGRLKLESP